MKGHKPGTHGRSSLNLGLGIGSETFGHRDFPEGEKGARVPGPNPSERKGRDLGYEPIK